jgi:hypothetical protein
VGDDSLATAARPLPLPLSFVLSMSASASASTSGPDWPPGDDRSKSDVVSPPVSVRTGCFPLGASLLLAPLNAAAVAPAAPAAAAVVPVPAASWRDSARRPTSRRVALGSCLSPGPAPSRCANGRNESSESESESEPELSASMWAGAERPFAYFAGLRKGFARDARGSSSSSELDDDELELLLAGDEVVLGGTSVACLLRFAALLLFLLLPPELRRTSCGFGWRGEVGASWRLWVTVALDGVRESGGLFFGTGESLERIDNEDGARDPV